MRAVMIELCFSQAQKVIYLKGRGARRMIPASGLRYMQYSSQNFSRNGRQYVDTVLVLQRLMRRYGWCRNVCTSNSLKAAQTGSKLDRACAALSMHIKKEKGCRRLQQNTGNKLILFDARTC